MMLAKLTLNSANVDCDDGVLILIKLDNGFNSDKTNLLHVPPDHSCNVLISVGEITEPFGMICYCGERYNELHIMDGTDGIVCLWRIYIVHFLDATTFRVQILSISCKFWENLAKSYVGVPPDAWCPPSWGNSGSATVYDGRSDLILSHNISC